MAIYMKINGINGNVTTKGYENTIELLGLNLKFSQDIQTKVGSANNRSVNTTKISRLSTSKITDVSSCHLVSNLLTNKVIPTVEIFLCSVEKNKGVEHVKYTLSNVLISQIEQLASQSSSIPIEHLELDFTKIEQCFHPTDAVNKTGSQFVIGFDLEKAAVV